MEAFKTFCRRLFWGDWSAA